MTWRRASLLLAVALLGVTRAAAQEFPKLTQPVHDLAGLLDPGTIAELDRRVRGLQASTGDVIVVVTVPTLGNYTVEDYAVRLFEQMGIGQKGSDNGLLVLVARDERKVRIEVGYALEEFVNDGYAGDVIRQQMLPEFRRGDYAAGVLAGTTRLIQ
jgi:uncharacterized protein